MTLVQDVMTPSPETATRDARLTEIATMMRASGTGFIPITDGDRLAGVVTDRDIVVRAVAEGRDPQECRAGDICSERIIAIDAHDDAHDAARRMREAQVRRIAVVDEQRLVGVVSIGDLAHVLDPDSALAEISDAPPST